MVKLHFGDKIVLVNPSLVVMALPLLTEIAAMPVKTELHLSTGVKQLVNEDIEEIEKLFSLLDNTYIEGAEIGDINWTKLTKDLSLQKLERFQTDILPE